MDRSLVFLLLLLGVLTVCGLCTAAPSAHDEPLPLSPEMTELLAGLPEEVLGELRADKPIPCSNKYKQIDCGNGWACLNSTCTRCRTTADCRDINQECVFQENLGVNVCRLKSLFPFHLRDYLCTFFAFPVAMLASATGLGGGPLFVPLLILVLDLSPYLAIPLSKTMVLGVAVANLFINLPKSHPVERKKPLIDFSAALILEPATLLGTVIGVFLNTTLPVWVIVVLISVTTGSITLRTVGKARRLWREEKRQNEVAALEVEEEYSEDDGFSRDSRAAAPLSGYESAPESGMYSAQPLGERLARSLWGTRRCPSLPIGKIMGLVAVWGVLFLVTLAKGGQTRISLLGVRKCSVVYWLLYAFPVPFIVGATILVGYLFLKKQAQESLEDPASSGIINADSTMSFAETREDETSSLLALPALGKHIRWNKKRVMLYPFFGVVAGIIAGLMGLGGGMVKGPLLLELGVDPSSSSATSLWMILFTAGATTMQFALLGRIRPDYGIWYAMIALVSSFVGKILVNKFIVKYKKTSIIIMGFVLFLGTSCVILTYLGILEAIANFRKGGAFAFNSLCALTTDACL